MTPYLRAVGITNDIMHVPVDERFLIAAPVQLVRAPPERWGALVRPFVLAGDGSSERPQKCDLLLLREQMVAAWPSERLPVEVCVVRPHNFECSVQKSLEPGGPDPCILKDDKRPDRPAVLRHARSRVVHTSMARGLAQLDGRVSASILFVAVEAGTGRRE